MDVLPTFDVASVVEDISVLYALCSVVQSAGRQSIYHLHMSGGIS